MSLPCASRRFCRLSPSCCGATTCCCCCCSSCRCSLACICGCRCSCCCRCCFSLACSRCSRCSCYCRRRRCCTPRPDPGPHPMVHPSWIPPAPRPSLLPLQSRPHLSTSSTMSAARLVLGPRPSLSLAGPSLSLVNRRRRSPQPDPSTLAAPTGHARTRPRLPLRSSLSRALRRCSTFRLVRIGRRDSTPPLLVTARPACPRQMRSPSSGVHPGFAPAPATLLGGSPIGRFSSRRSSSLRAFRVPASSYLV